jgi:hypothetical protein
MKPARSLDDVLERLGAKLAAWQVRALFLGAQVSLNLRLGPQHLLPHIFGDDLCLGDDLADANQNLQSLMALWNDLLTDFRKGRPLLSPLPLSASPSAAELDAFCARRDGEITWFIRGIDAGGDHPSDYGESGELIFRRLAEAGAFFDSTRRLLAKHPDDLPRLPDLASDLGKLSGAIDRLVSNLMDLSNEIRRQAIAESAGLPQGVPVHRPAKVGRNEPCPCGSGKKWKRCCGAPSTLQ